MANCGLSNRTELNILLKTAALVFRSLTLVLLTSVGAVVGSMIAATISPAVELAPLPQSRIIHTDSIETMLLCIGLVAGGLVGGSAWKHTRHEQSTEYPLFYPILLLQVMALLVGLLLPACM